MPERKPIPNHDTPPSTIPSMAVIAAYVAALDIANAVDLDSTLQLISDLARTVVPSRYAAIGVADDNGNIIAFITSGMTSHERNRIGHIPVGLGLLGELIHHRKPLIVDSIGDDPNSVGFPPNHPPMRDLLGVPVTLGDTTLGNLYLTERLEGRRYDKDDLLAVQVLAAYAASAIDRARVYNESRANRLIAEEQRDQLEVILDSLPTAVLIVPRTDDRPVELNATGRRLFDVDAERVPTPVVDYWLESLDGHLLDQGMWPMNRALNGEVVRNRQLNLCLMNGLKKPVLIQSVPLRDATGDVVRAVVVLQDITRLREAEQLKDDFLSLISHEFRTPLTAIQGGASLLVTRGDALDTETRQELLENIYTESQTLEQLLTNILTLTEVQAGRLDASLEPILVSAVLRHAIDAARNRDADHEYLSDTEPNVPYAEGDPDLLDQVLHNLYENAAKYSPAGTMIRTTVAYTDTTVTIAVVDQGSGIAPMHIDSIFQRFRRPGADPGVRGMGLGLYLSKHLIDAQHGTIEAVSDGPGQGSTFSITLPRAVLDPEEE